MISRIGGVVILPGVSIGDNSITADGMSDNERCTRKRHCCRKSEPKFSKSIEE